MIRFFFFWTRQYSRSEVMLTFFERSPLDQVLRNDKVHRIQPCIQSPIKISGGWSPGLVGGATLHLDRVALTSRLIRVSLYFSEIMRSNGFCLANTETIVFDDSPPEEKDRPSSTDSAEHL